MKKYHLKNLIKEQIKLHEQGGTLTSQEQIWNESGCLIPGDLYHCPDCIRDCVGELHGGVVNSTIWQNLFGGEVNFSDHNDDFGHTCCCATEGDSWMWQPEPNNNPGLYEMVHDWRNPCCYGDITNSSGVYGVAAMTSNHPSPNFTCSQIEGCLDPNASNYDPGASFDCIGQPQNGMVTWAGTDAFDFLGPNNQLGDTCCCSYEFYVNGILQNTAEPEGNISEFDSSCEEYENYLNELNAVYGCTNPDANNYNPEATIDDNSCEYGPFSDPSPKQLTCYTCERNNQIELPKNVKILSTTQTLDGNWIIAGDVYPEAGIKPSCPKGWTTDPDPCPGVSPIRDNIECYKCDIDGTTVLTQFFPQISEKGCPVGWDINPDPCPGFDLSAQDEECPYNSFGCDATGNGVLNLAGWISEFIDSVMSEVLVPGNNIEGNVVDMANWCQGCAGNWDSIFGGNWENYFNGNNPCLVGSLEEACACCPVNGGNDPSGCDTDITTFSCSNLDNWASCFINPNQLNVLFTGGSFNFNYWCQGCAGNVNGLSGGSWENYILTSDPSFFGSYEEACACCPQGMPTSPIKERFQKLAGIKKIK